MSNKNTVLLTGSLLAAVSTLAFAFAAPEAAAAEEFFDFTRAIPETGSNGVPLDGANTVFADGSGIFQPGGDLARSNDWNWRAFGNDGILSSLGPQGTPPTNTRELATTIRGLEPGQDYAVRVLFWSPGGDTGTWGIRAGLGYGNESRPNPWFNRHSAGVLPASLLPWKSIPSVFEESPRILFAAPLGTATADLDGEITVYIHDYPTAQTNLRTWYDGVAVSPVTDFATHTIDAGTRGNAFNPGVRGIALGNVAITRGDHHLAMAKSLEVSRGGALRGVATGLAAEIYDWRTRNNEPRETTLEFLRFSRDQEAELWLGTNLRGLIEPDPNGGFRYYDTNPAMLAELAADWVRYANHIVPNYRQGDAIDDPRDQAILDSLIWSSAVPGDSFDKLLAPGEAAIPKVVYWEIGNEPTIAVTAYSITNSFNPTPTDFRTRYQAIAEAIKAEDPTVKVGPTLVHAGRDGAHLAAIASNPNIPIDFITYHPYEGMNLLNDSQAITQHLKSVHTRQTHFLNEIKRVVIEQGRDPDLIEYGATEVNVSNWSVNETIKEAQVAHALGTVETIFSHARLGLVVSHYWIWPAHAWDGTEYPVFKAYQKLRDHMGDTLLSTYAFGDIRVYTTRDRATGKIAIWTLNFSDSEDTAVDLGLANLPDVERATLLRLEHYSGTTSLQSANPASDMPGGPAINVDWTASDLTGVDLSDFELIAPAATLSVLVIEPAPLRLTSSLQEREGEMRLAVSFRRLEKAEGLRYVIFGSDDLVTWEVIEEVEPGIPEVVTVFDNRSIDEAERRFMQVKLQRED